MYILPCTEPKDCCVSGKANRAMCQLLQILVASLYPLLHSERELTAAGQCGEVVGGWKGVLLTVCDGVEDPPPRPLPDSCRAHTNIVIHTLSGAWQPHYQATHPPYTQEKS